MEIGIDDVIKEKRMMMMMFSLVRVSILLYRILLHTLLLQSPSRDHLMGGVITFHLHSICVAAVVIPPQGSASRPSGIFSKEIEKERVSAIQLEKPGSCT